MGTQLLANWRQGARLTIADAKTVLATPPLGANVGIITSITEPASAWGNEQFDLEIYAAGSTNLTVANLWAAVQEPFTYADTVFTTTHGADTFQITAHGLGTGTGPLQVSSGTTLPAGLVVFNPVTRAGLYWVIKVDADNFKVATSLANAFAGTAVDLTSNGSGTHTISDFTTDQDRTQRVTFMDMGQLGNDVAGVTTVALTVDNGYVDRFWRSPRHIGYAVSATLSAAVATTVVAYPVGSLR